MGNGSEKQSVNGGEGAQIYYPHGFKKWVPKDIHGKPLSEDDARRFRDANNGSLVGSNIFFVGGITNVPPEYFQRHIEFLIARMWNMWFGHNKNPALALLDTESELGKTPEDKRAPVCYNIDQKAVEWSNLIIAEASVPSTGTGQELERAVSSGKPIILMVRRVVRDMEVKPLTYYAETKPHGTDKKGDVVEIKTLPGLGGVSPMVQGNPNVVAVIVYDDENAALKKLSTVMEEIFDDKHLSEHRKRRLEEDRKLYSDLTRRLDYFSGKTEESLNLKADEKRIYRELKKEVGGGEPGMNHLCIGINVPERHDNLLRMKPKDAIAFLKGELKDDFKYLDSSRRLFNFTYSLRHPDDIKADVVRPGDPLPPERHPPIGAKGIMYSHIRMTHERPSYPPTFPERVRRDGAELLKKAHLRKKALLEEARNGSVEAEEALRLSTDSYGLYRLHQLRKSQSSGGVQASDGSLKLSSGVTVEWGAENVVMHIPSANNLAVAKEDGVSLSVPTDQLEMARGDFKGKVPAGGLSSDTIERIEELWKKGRERDAALGEAMKLKREEDRQKAKAKKN